MWSASSELRRMSWTVDDQWNCLEAATTVTQCGRAQSNGRA